jgi:hypothetical protein
VIDAQPGIAGEGVTEVLPKGVDAPVGIEVTQRIFPTQVYKLRIADERDALTASGWQDDSEPTPAQLDAYITHLERMSEVHQAWHLEHKRPWRDMYERPTTKPATTPPPRERAPAPEPPPEPGPEPEPVTLDRGPTGPAFAAAALELNWYVARILHEPGKAKLKKIPLDGAGHYVDVKLAATLTLAVPALEPVLPALEPVPEPVLGLPPVQPAVVDPEREARVRLVRHRWAQR